MSQQNIINQPKMSTNYHSMMQQPLSTPANSQSMGRTIDITLPYHRLQEQIELYEWRSHQAHIISYQWVKIQPVSPHNAAITLKTTQNLTTLDKIKKVKGNCLSKIFTAFALLYHKFGPFQLSPTMIAFNIFYDPFVWINGLHFKNQYKRDLISEEQFAHNILALLLKHQHLFQHNQIQQCHQQLKGKELGLDEMLNFFSDIQEKDFMAKNSKMGLSQGSTLCFSKQSRIRKQNRVSFDFRGLNAMNKETFRSVMQVSDKQANLLQRSGSLTDIKEGGQSELKKYDHVWSPPCESEVRINVIGESGESFLARENWCLDSLPVCEELHISIDESCGEEMEEVEVSLEQLDRFKRFLAKSIITSPN